MWVVRTTSTGINPRRSIQIKLYFIDCRLTGTKL